MSTFCAQVVFCMLSFAIAPAAAGTVQVALLENLPADKVLDPPATEPTTRYTEPAFAFVRIPAKYSPNALPLDRSTPFVLRATLTRELPEGDYEFRLRSKGAARFVVDGETRLTTKPQRPNGAGHDPVPPPVDRGDSLLRPAPFPHQDVTVTLHLAAGPHEFLLLAVIGGKGLAPEPGELSVSMAHPGEVSRLLGADDAPLLTDAAWAEVVRQAKARHHKADVARRRAVSAPVVKAWEERHARVRAWLADQPAPTVPPGAADMPAYNDVDRFIGARLAKAGKSPTALTDDLAFLRRVTLDTIGVIPTPKEIRAFQADPPDQRRTLAIDRLLDHPGWADHWVSYWQDVLAENPGILKPDLNNTGPFRWWLHQSFTDRVPFDRLVTELIEMEGSKHLGGPAGFGQAWFARISLSI